MTLQTLLVTLLLAVALPRLVHGRTQAADDFVACMQRDECGLEYVCDYDLAEEQLTGTIARIRSNLDTPILAVWSTSSHEGAVEHPVRIDPHSSHLIRTTSYDTRMIQLVVDGTPVDTLTMRHSRAAVCPEHLACQYLLHACYNSIDDDACDRGTAFCNKVTGPGQSFAREACIPSCLSSFYGTELENYHGDPFHALETPAFNKYTYDEADYADRYSDVSGLSQENADALRKTGTPLLISDGEKQLVAATAHALGMSPVEGYDVAVDSTCVATCPGLVVTICILVLAVIASAGTAVYYYLLYKRHISGRGGDGDTLL